MCKVVAHGVVSIVRDGQVQMKLVVQCNGRNSLTFGHTINSRGKIPTLRQAYETALGHRFGCPDCLVVLVEGNVLCRELGMVGKRFVPTFNEELFNPNAADGHADHVVVVTLRSNECPYKHIHDWVEEGKHGNVVTRFCKACGLPLNPVATVIPNCEAWHPERRAAREKFCPDCGDKL